jgi:hypothetical protein
MKLEYVTVEDITVGVTKRLSVKALTDTENKEEIKSSLSQYINELSYWKNRVYKVVYLNIYTHKRQTNYGLPLCTVQWVSEDAEIKPNAISHNDQLGDILIDWNSFFKSTDEMVTKNEVSPLEFLEKTKFRLNETLEIVLKFNDLKDKFVNEEISITEFKEYANEHKTNLDHFENDFIGFPPSDKEHLVKLQSAVRNTISSAHNILVVLNNNYPESNMIYLAFMHLEEAKKELNESYSILKEIYGAS